jgi:hypothetical protein
VGEFLMLLHELAPDKESFDQKGREAVDEIFQNLKKRGQADSSYHGGFVVKRCQLVNCGIKHSIVLLHPGFAWLCRGTFPVPRAFSSSHPSKSRMDRTISEQQKVLCLLFSLLP